MCQSQEKAFKSLELLQCLHSQMFRVSLKKKKKRLFLPSVTIAAEPECVYHFCHIPAQALNHKASQGDGIPAEQFQILK